MKKVLILSLSAVSLIAPLQAGESVADSIAPATTVSNEGQQNFFGPPYIKFGRNNSDTLLPGYAVGTTSYVHRFTSDFDDTALGDVSSDSFSLWAPFIGLNHDSHHLFAWVNYGATKYNTSSNSTVNLLTEHTMQTLQIPLVYVHDISEKWLWGGMVMGTYAGTHSSSDNFALSTAIAVGYTYSPCLQLFGGAYYFNGFNDDTVLPGIGFIWRPDNRWEAYLLGPIGGISYAVTDKFFLSFEGQYEAPEWHVKADKLGPDRDISMSSLRLSLKAEFQVYDVIWAYVAGGYSVMQTMEIEDSNNNMLQDSDIDPSPFIQIGLNARF